MTFFVMQMYCFSLFRQSPLLDWPKVDVVELLSLQASPMPDAAVDWPEVDVVELLCLQASPLLGAAVDWPEVDVVELSLSSGVSDARRCC